MNRIKTIIVDDEPLARDVIREFVKKHPAIDIIAEGETGIDAVNMVNELSPDLLFLDIQMPEMNGFDALKEIAADQLPLIVFATAHDTYALKAFEASAIDYLLKPFDQDRFDKAVERALKYLSALDRDFREAERLKLLNYYEKLIGQRNRPEFIERLLVRDNKKIFPVPVKDVQIFEADNDYVRLHVDGDHKKHLINNSLANLETLLDPSRFVRIHKSTIIRIDAIVEMQSHFNGEYKILMKNGTQVKLSRSYKDALQKISGEGRG